MVKRGGVIFIFLFAFLILLIGAVSSASCSVTTSCASSNTVMKLSSTTNAHGSLYNQGAYSYYLCCDFTGTHTCSGSNKVLGLSATTNAHAQIPSLSGYTSSVCFGDLTCYDTTGSCNSGDIQMLSLSATSNAHLAQFSTYGTRICCSPNLGFCGNGVLESPDEECDDGNTNDLDGCSSLCVVESGYTCSGTSPTCCQITNPTSSWQKNSASFNGGELIAGDVLTMRFNEDFCVAPGTTLPFYIYEGSTQRASVQGTVVAGTPGYTYATYTVTNSFLTSLGANPVIFFRIPYPRQVDSSTIAVIPRYCGDGTCTSANGETCSSCVSDCVCSPGSEECISGVCTGLCDLTSAAWNTTSAVAGQPVRLNLAGTNCNGKTINFGVWEDDDALNPDDSVTPGPSSIVYGSPNTYGLWNVIYQDDTDGGQSNPPEYYFTASVAGYSESITSSASAELSVTQPAQCGNGNCQSGENCLTCPQDCICSGATPTCSQSGVCVAECILNTAEWMTTNAEDGDSVQLRVTGTNCNGQTVSFEVREDDPLSSSSVAINPSSVTMNSGVATGTWIAEWPDLGGETTPEYFFIARINVLGKELQSSRNSDYELHVSQSIECGDGSVDGTEACDDGGIIPGDGCSATCTIETGYTCNGEPSICSLTCPNGVINSPGEECDGTNLGGATCTSEMGGGWTGTLSCSQTCQFDTSGCIAPASCTIRDTIWNKASAMEGENVQLLVQTENCNDGESISFVVEEYDSGILDGHDNVEVNPSNALTVGNTAIGLWYSEFQDDNGGILSSETNPPEYFFTATIVSNGQQRESSEPKLSVTENNDAECSEVGYCVNYLTQSSCNADSCNVGEESVPGAITCGGTFNSETGCYDNIACGCSWNTNLGKCESDWDSESSCGICGNHVRDFGEECDDGNTENGDGCSSLCQFEDDIDSPCPYGTTLCSDGTCSLNCDSTDEGVADCNYDATCDSREGCTCTDCIGKIDNCAIGLICNIFDNACCNAISDGECNPYCSYVDPDCAPAECGNGYQERGEECDLGIRNSDPNSGCLINCKYEVIDPLITGGCPEGTALCNDGTCSLNCYSTDQGIEDNNDDTICVVGLGWSLVDQACCNAVNDNYCNPFCSYYDPDCLVNPLEEDSFPIGTCSYTENGADTCEDDGRLVRSLTSNWIWHANNDFGTTNPDGEDYWLVGGLYRYDPFDFSGLRKSEKCTNIEDVIICPAQIEVPFFNIYNMAVAVAIIVLIYLILHFSNKNKNPPKKRKKK